MSEECEWTVDGPPETWTVTLLVKSELEMHRTEARFDELINDFQLRWQLEKNTRAARQRIIESALNLVDRTYQEP